MIYKSKKYNIDFSKILAFWTFRGEFLSSDNFNQRGFCVKILLGNDRNPPHELILLIGKVETLWKSINNSYQIERDIVEYNIDSDDYKLYEALEKYWEKK